VLKRVSARATLKKSLFASVFLCILARESAVAQNLSLSLGNGVLQLEKYLFYLLVLKLVFN